MTKLQWYIVVTTLFALEFGFVGLIVQLGKIVSDQIVP